MGLLKIVSWNIDGCHHGIKRKKILTYLKQKKTDIALIQESHLNDEESAKLKRDWVGQIFYSTFSSRKRGVAILIKKNLDFKVHASFSHEGGRWVVLDANMEGQRITLANIYAPNITSPDFFHEVCEVIRKIGNGNIIIGGDFNLVGDTLLDKSSQSRTISNKGSLAIDILLDELGLVDIWRVLHPQEREYTFYSHPHSTYSRIDYFLISNALVNQVADSMIGNIVLSDHAPVELVVSSMEDGQQSVRWRFNNSMLNSEASCAYIKIIFSEFWQFNEGSIDDSGIMWDACKAYVRGRLIQYSALLKKAEKQKLIELDQEIKTLSKQHSQQPDPETWRKLNKSKYEMNNIFQKKAEFALFRTKQKYYEQGERAGKILANRVKQLQNQNIISSIHTKDDRVTTDKKVINHVFRSFYQDLYTSQAAIDQVKLDAFFATIDLPSLSEQQMKSMEGDISIEEIHSAIRSLKLGKAPGDDGFTPDFYKKFSDIISPRLLEVYQDSLLKGSLPTSMRSATITLLQKKGKDPQYCGSYRPISLLNIDEKILAKILANRLEDVLPSLVHPDQVGFVKGRNSADNIRRLLHIMWKVRNDVEPTVAFSLDAEKAFDKVEFSFLFYTLVRFGFGPSFVGWVKLLYTNPMASVLTNGILSSPFNLGRGTRQGSPLSPQMFALFLEPLAIALRTNQNIKGVIAGQVEHKLFLYADDILLVSSNPQIAAGNIGSIIKSFSAISGYTINWSKSEAMPLSAFCPPDIRKDWQFRWMPSGLIYLGIKLIPGLKEIIRINIAPVIEHINALTQNWAKMNMSLLGKINLVKMIIAPKLNYILYMLPLTFPSQLLKQYDKVINEYLWGGKRPWFSRAKMYAAKENGGLSLPKIDWYHYAFSLSQLSKMNHSAEQAPAWVKIEEEMVFPSSLESFLTQSDRAIPFKNPLLSFARETWNQSHQLIRANPYLTARASIWFNKKLKVDKKTFMWEDWVKSGIHVLGDIAGEDGVLPFEDIKNDFGLDNKNFYRFLQIRHCISSSMGRPACDPFTAIQDLYYNDWKRRGGASRFYNVIREHHAPKLAGLKLSWESDIHEVISEEAWENLVTKWCKFSREAQSQLIFFKVLNRRYWTPSKLARLKLRSSDVCWRCEKETGTLLHMLYECEKVRKMWDEIVVFLSEILNEKLNNSPAACLLGLLPKEIKLSKYQGMWYRMAMISGCRIALRHWKSPTDITFKEWMELMFRTASYDRVTYRVAGREDIFAEVWGHFLHLTEGPDD